MLGSYMCLLFHGTKNIFVSFNTCFLVYVIRLALFLHNFMAVVYFTMLANRCYLCLIFYFYGKNRAVHVGVNDIMEIDQFVAKLTQKNPRGAYTSLP